MTETTITLGAHWLGFEYLENWAAQLDMGKPVTALICRERRSGNDDGRLGMLDLFGVFCQERGATIYYCSLLLAIVQVEGMQPINDAQALRLREAERAFEYLYGWLMGLGLEVLRASYARPKGFLLVRGLTDLIHYDPRIGAWIAPPSPNNDLFRDE